MTTIQNTQWPPLVCTVLPTYNERDNIGPLIERLLVSVPAPYMVLVVDDDSPDGTWQVVQDRIDRMGVDSTGQPPLALVHRTNEKGLTSAIQRGIDEAILTYGAGIVTWMDCDLSMPPEDVPRLVQPLRQGDVDLAIGSRWVPGGADVAHGLMARSLSWIINQWAMLLLGRTLHDYTSGFIAARAEVLQRVRLRGNYGEYCIDLLARATRLGYQLQEVPYVCVPRTAGASKTGANLWDYLVKGREYVATICTLFKERMSTDATAV